VRSLRAQAEAQAKAKPLPAPVTALLAKLAAVEAELYQVRNQSRQDPLNYPIKLNDKLAGLIGVIDSADAPPTDGARAVFADLSGQLARQLAALETALADLPAANAALQAQGLQPLRRQP
jgi:GAF domain-containing protein